MNHTVTTEFVLLGHSDDPDIHIVIFFFLFITYVLSVTGKPDYSHPNLGGLPSPDAHVSLPPKFLFLRSLLYCCVHPQISGGKYHQGQDYFLQMCSPIIFLYFQGGVTEFYILTAIVICCHLQAPVLYNHHEQETLPPACALCMAGRVSDHFLTPYASPPAGLVCFQCH